jgi:hypothetical protein
MSGFFSVVRGGTCTSSHRESGSHQTPVLKKTHSLARRIPFAIVIRTLKGPGHRYVWENHKLLML